MLAKKPGILELDRLPPESAEYLRAQSDQIAFLSQLILEHKRRVALDNLLDGYLAEVPQDRAAEQSVTDKLQRLDG